LEGGIVLSVRRIGLPALVPAIAAIVFAGCGGGGDGDASAASIPKAEFIKRADVICEEGGKQSQSELVAFVKKSGVPKGKEPTTAQWEEIGTEILAPALRRQAAEIRRLGVPAGDDAQVGAFLDGVDEAVEELEAEPASAKVPPKLLADADQAIAGYGFKVCGGAK
jgi:hypothetical protein